MGAGMVINISYKRLTGFWDNGLRWKRPLRVLNKYDTVSRYE